MTRATPHLAGAVLAVVIAIVITTVPAAAPVSGPAYARADDPAPCPLVFGHGGYPKFGDAPAKDRIRQPNNLRGVDDQAAWGADGVEADVQLTRQGTRAVMWHNKTTNGLTGPRQPIRETWWAAGPDNLRDRLIARGPYAGEFVPTLREWLDHVRLRGLIALLEIKRSARPVLADPVYGEQAWRNLVDPVTEREERQPILVYSHDEWIEAELARRLPAHLRGSAARWTDGVKWDEPPPPWQANIPRWQAVLDEAPGSVMTSYTREYRDWLSGACQGLLGVPGDIDRDDK